MKILFIGAATSNHTIRWVNSLSKKGHEVLLVCRSDQKDKNNQILSQVKIKYLKFGGQTYSYYFNVPQIRYIYKKFNPDIVNAHYATGYGTLARIARLKPLVISCWGSDVFDFPNHGKWCLNILRKNFNYSNAVASTSEAMAKEAKKHWNNPNRKVIVTPFGVDLNLFSPEIKKHFNNRPVIGLVKYLEPIYDIQLLIRAFSIVYNQLDVKPLLKIYGSGSLKKELIELAKELNIDEAVKFTDTIPNTEVPQVLNTFDVFVNCSLRESFGVALVEAMSCCVPVVVTDTVGFREVVVDEVTGIILKDREPQTMAKALIRLLNNQELRIKFGKAGRKRVEELYDWEKNVEIMENLFYKVKSGEKV